MPPYAETTRYINELQAKIDSLTAALRECVTSSECFALARNDRAAIKQRFMAINATVKGAIGE